MRHWFAITVAACMGATTPAVFAGAMPKRAEMSPSPTGQQTTRRGSPLKGVRIGRTFTRPAPAIEH